MRIVIAIAAVVVLAASLAVLALGAGGPAGTAGTAAGALSATHAPGTTRPGDDPAPADADPLGAAAASWVRGRDGTVAAAVYDMRTGQTWSLGAGRPQAEASAVKLDILETLLARNPGGLPAGDQRLAREMIEDSDNDAATALWYAAGGAAGIGSFNSAAGLSRTALSSCVRCPGFEWPGWGLTTTVPADQLALLRLVAAGGPRALLTSAQRKYVLTLMENVTASQRWGVSGGVPPGVAVALKNGWLPLDAAGTDWQVNSMGWVRGDGRDYLIVVLSTGNPSERYGIDTTDRLSALVWDALR